MNARLRSLLAAGVAAVTLSALTVPAQAQITVWDPTNYTQNVLQAARSLQQVTNQTVSYTHLRAHET